MNVANGHDERDRGVEHRVGDVLAHLRHQRGTPRSRSAHHRPTPRGSRRPPATIATLPAPAAIAVRRATSAVASLKSDSPSRIVTIRRGSPIRRPIEVAATASGGATTAPIANAAHQSEAGQQRVHQPPDTQGREHDQADAEQQDRAPVGVEVDERRLDRGGVEQRRQQAEEHDVGGQVHGRHGREVRHDDPDDDQPERRREADALRERRTGEHRDRQRDEQERDLHPAIVSGGVRFSRVRATQRIGSPQPSSSMPCRARAITTSVRRYAANVSTWAIMPP